MLVSFKQSELGNCPDRIQDVIDLRMRILYTCEINEAFRKILSEVD